MRVNKYRYKEMEEELDRLRNLAEPLPDWVKCFSPTQREADFLFDLLIGKSWESSEHFDICQSAWDIVALVLRLHTEEYRTANAGQKERVRGEKAKQLRRVWKVEREG